MPFVHSPRSSSEPPLAQRPTSFETDGNAANLSLQQNIRPGG
jgi:hypothetical protein